MTGDRDYEVLDAALRRSGVTWDAAQVHGLITARLAVQGGDAGRQVVAEVLERSETVDAARREPESLLRAEIEATHRALSERLSEFSPLLPEGDDSTGRRTQALAHWCEGFLHGLMSTDRSSELARRLADEPIADIITDMLQMTRAVADEGGDHEEEEQAYTEIVEYLRVAAQLIYEELADTRPASPR